MKIVLTDEQFKKKAMKILQEIAEIKDYAGRKTYPEDKHQYVSANPLLPKLMK